MDKDRGPMTDRRALRTPRHVLGVPLLVDRPRRWRQCFVLFTVLVAIAGPWLYGMGRIEDDPTLPGGLVLAVWLTIGGAAKTFAAPIVARDLDLYRRAAAIANRLFLRWVLPVGAVLVVVAALAGADLSRAALFYLGFPGVLLVTRLIELVALWIAPDGGVDHPHGDPGSPRSDGVDFASAAQARERAGPLPIVIPRNEGSFPSGAGGGEIPRSSG